MLPSLVKPMHTCVVLPIIVWNKRSYWQTFPDRFSQEPMAIKDRIVRFFYTWRQCMRSHFRYPCGVRCSCLGGDLQRWKDPSETSPMPTWSRVWFPHSAEPRINSAVAYCQIRLNMLWFLSDLYTTEPLPRSPTHKSTRMIYFFCPAQQLALKTDHHLSLVNRRHHDDDANSQYRSKDCYRIPISSSNRGFIRELVSYYPDTRDASGIPKWNFWAFSCPKGWSNSFWTDTISQGYPVPAGCYYYLAHSSKSRTGECLFQPLPQFGIY